MITEDMSAPAVNHLITPTGSVDLVDARSTINEPQSRSSRSIFRRFTVGRINWMTSSFLMGTLALALTAVPLYLWYFGLDWFQVTLFLVFAATTGFSITLGYHRLFTH